MSGPVVQKGLLRKLRSVISYAPEGRHARGDPDGQIEGQEPEFHFSTRGAQFGSLGGDA